MQPHAGGHNLHYRRTQLPGGFLRLGMGGYSLAISLAQDHEIGLMSGCITAAMLGCTLVFSLPVGLGLIEKEDRPYFFQGLLIGLITIPVGSIVGGVTAVICCQ